MKESFVVLYLPVAVEVWKRFGLNPSVVLAQAAIESAWGESVLAERYHNFFGITGYGPANEFWHGAKVQTREEGLLFRRYDSPENGFMDFGRLISKVYRQAAAVTFLPESYAHEIAYSRYISETNGDNRQTYRNLLVEIEDGLRPLILKRLRAHPLSPSDEVLAEKLTGIPPLFHPSEEEGVEKDELYWWDRY